MGHDRKWVELEPRPSREPPELSLRNTQSEESLSSSKKRKEKERWISSQRSPKSKSQASTSESPSSRTTSENSISSNTSSNSSKTSELNLVLFESQNYRGGGHLRRLSLIFMAFILDK